MEKGVRSNKMQVSISNGAGNNHEIESRNAQRALMPPETKISRVKYHSMTHYLQAIMREFYYLLPRTRLGDDSPISNSLSSTQPRNTNAILIFTLL